MPQNAIICINYTERRHKAVKGIKFRDHQNEIDLAISTGVNCISNGPSQINQGTGNESDVARHEIIMEQPEENADVNEDLIELDADADNSNGETYEHDKKAEVDNTEDAE